jgi:hypothetical protein
MGFNPALTLADQRDIGSEYLHKAFPPSDHALFRFRSHIIPLFHLVCPDRQSGCRSVYQQKRFSVHQLSNGVLPVFHSLCIAQHEPSLHFRQRIAHEDIRGIRLLFDSDGAPIQSHSTGVLIRPRFYIF